MVTKHIYIREVLAAMLLWIGVQANAQVYSCDFESDTENSAWSLNHVNRATQLENK